MTPDAPRADAAEGAAHWSDCAVHRVPAYPAGECNCGAALAAEVIAAARAWKQARRNMSTSWLEVVGAAIRLERAVDAYEAAIGGAG